ncbi:hypothetical protein PVK06_020509 [Gossypium arboreum]|uniref:Uncharacterized protein n=1 Tax=Gossypium arboreum TaxID=29729 RepID=A0ABR0PMJ2_GOSAR|nr:hypothetical protein PVK06_020509 [Gossypium arboreum]
MNPWIDTRSNYIVHAQVTVGLVDVSQDDFSYLHHYVNKDLSFNVLNPFGLEWEEFKKKCKDSDDFFYPSKPESTTLSSIEEASDEGDEITEKTVDPLDGDNA